jgi:SecD/SecF fusion protein
MYKKTGWGFAFTAFMVGLCIYLLARENPIQLGIDLQGGTELTYKLDLSHIARDRAQVTEEVKDIIAKRLNAYGLKEISVAAVKGQDQLVIQLPGTDSQSVGELKYQIEKAGNLTFRLVAPEEYQGPERRKQFQEEEREFNAKDTEWVEKKRADASFNEPRPQPPEYLVRTEVVKVKMAGGREKFQPKPGGEKVLENKHHLNEKTGTWEPEGIVSGSYLSSVGHTLDTQTFKPAVSFEFKAEGARLFGDLTGTNVGRLLAIVLDDDVMEVATIRSQITSRGELTGNFSDDDVKGIITVLRGGSLPTKPALISESTVGSVLGQDSVKAGIKAVIFGVAGVMIFMLVYYMIGGMIANVALLINLLFILAFVSCFRQTLTLPGIAGILLTLGMAVDANILIFERYREERRKGKTLSQALSAGYQRAFWVIFDSNLTTIITGYVLFYMGTGPVKGFAITLISGLFASFFTSVYVTRLILSWLVNHGLLRDLKLLKMFDTPRIPFTRYQKQWLMGSVIIIAICWVFVILRGQGNYGIDFTGGARVSFNLAKPMKVEDVRQRIGSLARKHPELFRDFSVQALGAEKTDASGLRGFDQFAILTREPDASFLSKAEAQEPQSPAGNAPGQGSPGAGDATRAPAGAAKTDPGKTEPAKTEAPKVEAPGAKTTTAPQNPTNLPETPPTLPGTPTTLPGTPPTLPGTPTTLPPASTAEPPHSLPQPVEAGEGEAQKTPDSAQRVKGLLEKMLRDEGLLLPPAFPTSGTRWETATGIGVKPGSQYLSMEVNLLKVESTELTPERLKDNLNAALEKEKDGLFKKSGRDPNASYPGIQIEDVKTLEKPSTDSPVTRYLVKTTPYQPPLLATVADPTIPTRRQVEEAIRDYFVKGSGEGAQAAQFQVSDPFPQVATVGKRVASSLQGDALVAIFISFLGIIFYLALRFEFNYGLAGVVALLHDVMISIGIMAVTDQFFSADFPVKFNLNELAAILTIIGFSINDTIVLFDRVRENAQLLAKKKPTIEELVDISTNQTLSRTLWTSLTVLIVTIILLGFGGESVRGFAYIFAIGVVTGTYSSICVASPVAIWLHNRSLARRQALATTLA